MSNDFTVDVSASFLDHDTSGIADIGAEQLLADGEHCHAGGSAELDVHDAREKLIIAIQKGIVESNADLVGVQNLLFLMLLQLICVLFENVPELRVKILWKPLFQECAHLLAILAVTVTNSEEMAVFEAAEVWHCDPNVLIYLLGI